MARFKTKKRRGHPTGEKNLHKRGTGTLYTRLVRGADGQRVAVYYARFVVDGQRVTRNTGKTSRAEAEAELARLLDEEKAARHTAEKDEVKRRRAIEAATKTAEAAYAEKVEADRHAEEERNALLIADAFQLYRKRLAEVHQRRRKVVDEATVDRYEAQFAAFAGWMGANHPEVTTMRRVTPGIAQEWLDSLSALSGGSLNKRIVLMRSVWNLLGSAVWYRPDPKKPEVRNPWDGEKRGGIIDKAKSDAVSKKPFTLDQVRRLLDLAQGEVKTLAYLAAFTGARLGDCVRFRWDWIDFDTREIRFTPHKTLHTSGKEVEVPLMPELAAHLKTLPGFARGAGYILPALRAEYDNDKGEKNKGPQTIVRNLLDPLYAKCGIVTREEGPDGKLHTVRGWHSWRHYFATRCLQLGVQPAEVQRMLGWTSDQMLKIYFNPDTKRILDRMDAAAPAPALPAPADDAASALAAFRASCDRLAAARLSAADWRKAAKMLATVTPSRKH